MDDDDDDDNNNNNNNNTVDLWYSSCGSHTATCYEFRNALCRLQEVKLRVMFYSYFHVGSY
jgi:hypothetical protein